MEATINIPENFSLYKACKKGQVEKARKLLKKGANPNVQNKNGYTLLHISENYKVIQLLLSYGVNVNATSKCGNTPLHFAAIRMNIQKMTQLLNCGADPNILNNRNDTALHHVLMNYGRIDQDVLLEAINILTDFGAEIDNQDYNAETALYLAVMGTHTKRMKSPPKTVLKLLQLGANPNISNSNGLTALHLAASKCNIHIMRILLEHGADPNALENYSRYSALHMAFDYNYHILYNYNIPDREKYRIEAIELLVKYGAKINFQDDLGMTVLHKAVGKYAYSTAKLLMTLGSDPNIRDNFGRSALEVALSRGCKIGIIKTLFP